MSVDYSSRSIVEKIKGDRHQINYLNIALTIILCLVAMLGVFPKYNFLNEQSILILLGIGTLILLLTKFSRSLKVKDVNLRYFGTEWLIGLLVTIGMVGGLRGDGYGLLKFNSVGTNYIFIAVGALFAWSLINTIEKTFKKGLFFLIFSLVLLVGVVIFFLQITGKLTVLNAYWDGLLFMQYILPFAYVSVAFGFMSLWKALQFSKKMWVKYVYLVIGLLLTGFYGFVSYGIRTNIDGGLSFTNALLLSVPVAVTGAMLWFMSGKNKIDNRVWYTVILGGIVGLIMGILIFHNGQKINIPSDWRVMYISFEESWGIVPKAISEDFGTLILGLGPNKVDAVIYKYRNENIYQMTGNRVSDALIPFGVSFTLAYGLLGIITLLSFIYFSFRKIIPLLNIQTENPHVRDEKLLLGVVLVLLSSLLIIPISSSFIVLLSTLFGVSVGSIYSLFLEKEKLFNVRLDLLVGNEKTGQQLKRFGVMLLLVPVFLMLIFVYNMTGIIRNEIKYVKTVNKIVGNNIDESIEKELLGLKDESRKFELLARYYYSKAETGLKVDSQLSDDQKQQLIDLLMNVSDNYVKLEGYNFNAWVLRGDIYGLLNMLSEGYYSQVVYNSYTSALQLNPLEPEIQLKIADLLLSVGEYNSAINWYVGIANSYPTYALHANYKIGLAYVGLEKYDEALALFTQLKDYIQSNIETGNINTEEGEKSLANLKIVIDDVLRRKGTPVSTEDETTQSNETENDEDE